MPKSEPMGKQCPSVGPGRCCVVIVTYDERYALIREVLERVLSLSVGAVIVVDNGTGSRSRRALTQREAREDCLSVLRLPENLGSAGGYAAGIQKAMQRSEYDYVWLLDDDNVPDQNALEALAQVYCELHPEWGTERLALLSLRPGREYLRLAAELENPFAVFPRRSSFMGFDVRDVPRKLKKVLGSSDPFESLPHTVNRRRSVRIPFGPYGGLFFHKSVVARIGLPNPNLYLYGDDLEFTRRIQTRGGALFLVPSSIVQDIEPAWWQKNPGKSSFSGLVLSESDRRVYYAIRNQVFFERSGGAGDSWLYVLNRWVFFLILLVTATRYKRWKRFQLVRRAARDGAKGRLGRIRLGSSRTEIQ